MRPTKSPRVIRSLIGTGRLIGVLEVRQRLARVEIPIALPVIIAGIRIAVVINIGVTAIAAYIGAGGLGTFISRGISQTDIRQLLTGALTLGLLAERGCTVVTGGLGEVMEAAARGAKAAGGTTIGVLPGERLAVLGAGAYAHSQPACVDQLLLRAECEIINRAQERAVIKNPGPQADYCFA